MRTRVLGYEDVEEEQKKQQKERSEEKKKKKFEKSAVAEEEKKETTYVERVDGEKKEDLPVEEKTSQKGKKAKSSRRTPVRGKKYKEKATLVEKKKEYTLEEAVALLKKTSYANFDESFEVHLNTDKKGMRGEVSFPHSMGKKIVVKIFDDEVMAQIEKGNIDFDILIAHPSSMPKLAKFARVLGPKGLMPNPKVGTISQNPEETAKKFESGSVQWKGEPKFPLVHQMVGKVSADDKAIIDNVKVFFESVGMKSIHAAFLTITMGPSVKIDLNSIV